MAAKAKEPAYVLYLRMIIEGLVDAPEDVKIKHRLDEMGAFIELQVSEQDMGKVVGRQGATVGAIRTLLHAMGRKVDAAVSLKILEPEGREEVRIA